MNIYYSAKERGFYEASVHEQIPKDGVKISPEEHAELLMAQSSGKLIVPDGNGYPVLHEPAPPTLEELAASERKWRDSALLATDGLVSRHRDEIESGAPTTLNSEQYDALQQYRQALRSWPDAGEFPLAEHRPLPPF